MLFLLSHRLHHLVLGQLVLALLLLVLLSLELLLLLLIMNGYRWILKQLQHVVVGNRVTWLPRMQ